MKKITRKEFVEILATNTSILAGSVFRRTDEECIRTMNSISEINEKSERRTVTEKHSTYILFTNGSRLDFNHQGQKEYFSYENENGINFALQKTTCDGQQNYVIYIIIQAEAEATRKFHGLNIGNEENKNALCRWLKANGYYYEASGYGTGYHLEIKCSVKEMEIINQTIKAA